MRGRGGRRAPSAQSSPIYCTPKVIVLVYWRGQGRDRCCPAWQRGELKKEMVFATQRCRGDSWGRRGDSWGQQEAAALSARQGGGSLLPPARFMPRLLARQDSLVYLLNREQHTVGQRTQASKPSISLSAPDILPLHCTIRKLRPSRHRSEEKLVLEPIAGAGISVNFSEVARTVVLRHGDLLSLGLYYLLLYKDPMKAQPLPAQTLLRLRALRPEGPHVCGACGSLLRDKDPAAKKRGPSPAGGPRTPRRKLQLEFEPAAEDVLLRRIMTLIEPAGDDHKLTPAFLLCLCVQHSATNFEPGDFGQLLLKAAKMIQRTVWVSRWGGVFVGWGCCSAPPWGCSGWSPVAASAGGGDARATPSLWCSLCSPLLSLPRSGRGNWLKSNPSSKCDPPWLASKQGEFNLLLPP